MNRASFRVEPMRRYRAPRYPRAPIDLQQVLPAPRTPQRRAGLVLRAIALGGLPLGVASCELILPPATGGSPPMSGYSLSESDALPLLREAFVARGLSITDAYPFVLDAVSFEADGYDPAACVGYELIDVDELSAPETPSAEERAQLASWASGAGPHFLILDGQDYFIESSADYEAHLDALRADIQRFLDELASAGVL